MNRLYVIFSGADLEMFNVSKVTRDINSSFYVIEIKTLNFIKTTLSTSLLDNKRKKNNGRKITHMRKDYFGAVSNYFTRAREV